MSLNNIAITIDTDWASDEVIQYTLDLLNKYNVKATFFITNKTDVNFGEHEVASHPNFLNNDIESELKKLREITPNAIGIRSHSLLTSNRHQEAFKKFGFKYTSNFVLDRQANIQPIKYIDLIELPIYFQDNLNIIEYGNNAFDIDVLKLNQKGLKVCIFHPMNIYLNIENMKRLERVKPYWKDINLINKNVNKYNKGNNDLFKEILEYINNTNIDTFTLKSILAKFK